MLCRLQEADRLPYGALAFQRWQVGELQCHPHTVLLGGVHPGHQPQVFQHIERQCLVDRARVYGDETADALQDFLPVTALEIICKWPLLYLLLSGRPLRLWYRTAAGVRCRRVAFGITASHPVL